MPKKRAEAWILLKFNGGGGPGIWSCRVLGQRQHMWWWVTLQRAGKQHITVSVRRARFEVKKSSPSFKLTGSKTWKQR